MSAEKATFTVLLAPAHQPFFRISVGKTGVVLLWRNSIVLTSFQTLKFQAAAHLPLRFGLTAATFEPLHK
jgi:hypothetical protein